MTNLNRPSQQQMECHAAPATGIDEDDGHFTRVYITGFDKLKFDLLVVHRCLSSYFIDLIGHLYLMQYFID